MKRIARGITLVETLACVTVLAVMGATVMPVIDAVGSGFAESVAQRRTVERLSFASDRISRVLREIPASDGGEGLAIASIDERSIQLVDGSGVWLDGERLVLATGAGKAVLCEDVDSFTIVALGSGGVGSTMETPSLTRRIGFEISSSGMSMRTAVFPRSAIGLGGE
ncbi:MAG: hypothetical protein KF912_07930 [Phycisphaeraceae bacterium]|nr:hypothetical protein [Phycisphaeraceae bacterium]MBX3367231.1 hypothetical protein [Phycisphaeraceae bacterium]QYK49418.1 MAG: hypothetical protein KF838_06095 [Phycisphaeraceae bacterium]